VAEDERVVHPLRRSGRRDHQRNGHASSVVETAPQSTGGGLQPATTGSSGDPGVESRGLLSMPWSADSMAPHIADGERVADSRISGLQFMMDVTRGPGTVFGSGSSMARSLTGCLSRCSGVWLCRGSRPRPRARTGWTPTCRSGDIPSAEDRTPFRTATLPSGTVAVTMQIARRVSCCSLG
jgi:hypothetical protein